MIVAVIEVDRIEIHGRGITAKPFGHGRTLIERARTRGLASGDADGLEAGAMRRF
jgi:hypothetical protein